MNDFLCRFSLTIKFVWFKYKAEIIHVKELAYFLPLPYRYR